MDLRRRSWHKLDIKEAVAALSVDPSRGLDEDDVKHRRELAGSNTLAETSRRSSLRAFLEQFQSPLIYILFIAALFAFALDRYGDSIVILVVVFINAVLGWFQERRAERSMEALRQLSVLRTMVVRDGTEKDLEVSELVPGDIILLAAGDGVGADARLLEVTVLEYWDEYEVVDASVILYDTYDDWLDEYNPLVEGFTNQFGWTTFSNLHTQRYYVDVWEANHDNYTLADEDVVWIETHVLVPNEINYFIAYVDYYEDARKSDNQRDRARKLIKIERVEKREYQNKMESIEVKIRERKELRVKQIEMLEKEEKNIAK